MASHSVGADVRAVRSLGVSPGAEGRVESLVRHGFPFRTLIALGSAYGLDTRALAGVLDISERSLARRKARGRLTHNESDRLFRVARIAGMAEEVLGDRKKASRWLQKPNRALGGSVPLEQLDTDIGARRVEAVLGRAAHGVVS